MTILSLRLPVRSVYLIAGRERDMEVEEENRDDMPFYVKFIRPCSTIARLYCAGLPLVSLSVFLTASDDYCNNGQPRLSIWECWDWAEGQYIQMRSPAQFSVQFRNWQLFYSSPPTGPHESAYY